jgi:transposase
LSLAAVADGMSREEAAPIGGMDRQMLRDWVHRFNSLGPDGLLDAHGGGPAARLSAEQKSELAALVEADPELERDGVVRWRQIDLQRVIKNRYGVDYDVRYVGKLLHQMGFSRRCQVNYWVSASRVKSDKVMPS